jgi:uncharacterized protein
MSGAAKDPGSLEMKVSQLTRDPITNTPILVLSEKGGGAEVSIWIGLVEASAIASELEKIPLQRPMPHDLMRALLAECGARVVRVEIRDVREGTFYASIFLERQAGEPPVEVDARPSDAVALALRTGAPICVARKVLRKSAASALSPLRPDNGDRRRSADVLEACDGETLDPAAWLELLESLPDEEFGKWKM